jgi:DNA-directed RNA polymerase specialized sigma24 family protein
MAAGHGADNDIRWKSQPMVCPASGTEDATARVVAAVRCLPLLERRIVELHHYQDKTITAAAKELSIGRPRASRLHARALATLRAILDGDSRSLPPSPRNASLVLDRHEGVSPGFVPAVGIAE